MRELCTILVLALMTSGCNVFLGLETGPGPNNTTTPPANNMTTPPPVNTTPSLECTGDCDCTDDCTVACAAGCDIVCKAGSACSGNVPDGSSVKCDKNALCEIACTGGDCSFSCKARDSDCFIDCPDDATCLLECGSRDGQQAEDCAFQNCADPLACDAGVLVCNRACP